MHFKLENTWNSTSASNTNDTNNYYVYPWHKTSKQNQTTTDHNDDLDETDEDEAAIAVLDDCDDLSLLVDEFDNYSPQTPPLTSTPKHATRIFRRTISNVSSNNASNNSTLTTTNTSSNNCISIKILTSNNASPATTSNSTSLNNTSSQQTPRKSKDFRLKDELANPECLEKLRYENILYKHTEEKPWICKNCGRNYKWKNSLKCHLRNECGVEPRYHCTKMCGYKTHIYSNLKRHLRSKFCRPVDGAITVVKPDDL